MISFNFIQDEATPHNNILLKELLSEPEVNLGIYYYQFESKQYAWRVDLANEIKPAIDYSDPSGATRLISNFLFKRNAKFFVVGWANPVTKLMLFLAFVFRVKFNIWFDHPNDNSTRSNVKTFFRKIFYILLKYSNIKIFCVGRSCVEYFIGKGFSRNRLVNLPIQVALNARDSDNLVDDVGLRIFSGSRLIPEKGYDVLLRALGEVRKQVDLPYRLYLIGDGPEKGRLQELALELGIADAVEFCGWISPDEYQRILLRSNVFVHPARWDAYGATKIALSCGVPAIGSTGAGAAVDCIVDGKNGFLYAPEDFRQLASHIVLLLNQPEQLAALSREAFRLESQKPCGYWVRVLLEESV